MVLDNLIFLDIDLRQVYSGVSLINFILLAFPCLVFVVYGFSKRNFSYILLGLGLFSLFVKEWLTMAFGYTFRDFTILVFWEIFFLFSFLWLVTRIYLRCVIEGNDYLFPSPKVEGHVHFTPLSSIVFPPHAITPFNPLGGIVLMGALLLLLTWVTAEEVQGVIVGIFFIAIVSSLERRFYYWKKDYANLGSPWTQPKVINSIRLFYWIFGLGFFFVAILGMADYFGGFDFFANINRILTLFAFLKVVAIAVLYWFFYRLLSYRSRMVKAFKLAHDTTRDWIEKTFPSDKRVSTSQELAERYPHLHYSQIEDGDTMSVETIRYLVELLRVSNSDVVYLHEPGNPHPEKRMVASSHEDIGLPPETHLPGVGKILEKRVNFFFHGIDFYSNALRMELGSLLPSSLTSNIQSFIVYPFTFHGRPCSLLLIDPEFNNAPSRFFQKEVLAQFTRQLEQIHASRKNEPSPQPLTTSSISQIETPVSPALQFGEDSSKTSGKGYSQRQRKEENDDQRKAIPERAKPKKRNLSRSLFSETRDKNKIILETNLEKAYVKNADKVVNSFHPSGHRTRHRAGNRQIDKIFYKVTELYTDQIQNALVMVSNIGRKGKLFVFNQFQQDHSLHAATNLNLLNLFYTYLPKKTVSVFAQEWQRGWKPFSSTDTCQFVAMEFHSENLQLSYFNAGISHAYIYNAGRNKIFPLDLHSPQLVPFTGGNPLGEIEVSHSQLNPHDLIVIFSKGLTEVKNRDGEVIDIDSLLNFIQESHRDDFDVMIKGLEKRVQDFAYSIVESQQLIFVAKILE